MSLRKTGSTSSSYSKPGELSTTTRFARLAPGSMVSKILDFVQDICDATQGTPVPPSSPQFRKMHAQLCMVPFHASILQYSSQLSAWGVSQFGVRIIEMQPNSPSCGLLKPLPAVGCSALSAGGLGVERGGEYVGK